ncbi:MAG: heme-binding protein [Betaproteobacteria bacterium]|nr:heme-binding protein [Betaproteobacteria bacterium]
MTYTRPGLKLTHEGVMHALNAGIERAKALGAPENITIVDDGGNLLGFVRMDGSKTFSIMTSHKKAMSAASHRQPSGKLDPKLELNFAAATEGKLTNLEGGFPILFDGVCVGGIGVGSGTGAQDCEVARAMLAALEAQAF